MKRDAALALARQGFKVFPITPGAKAPPLVVGWQLCATSDEGKVREWWAAWPDANIGVHCDGLIVLDIDPKKGGNDGLTALDIEHGVPATYEVTTPSGGSHLYYRSDTPVPNGVNTFDAGIDIRSTGGYVLAPGSDVQGKPYVLRSGTMVEAPDWLKQWKPKPKVERDPDAKAPTDVNPALAEQRAIEWLKAQPPVNEGERNHKGYAAATKLRDFGCTQDEALELLVHEWRCDPALPLAEIQHVVNSAFKYGQNPPAALAVETHFDNLEAIEPTPSDSPKTIKSPYPRRRKLSEIKSVGGNGSFIDGLCNGGELFQVIGAPGGRKSAAMAWMAYCVATGRKWFERETASGSVLYLAAERMGEQVKRLKVLALADGKAVDDPPWSVMGPGARLDDISFARYLAAECKQLQIETGAPTRLIVIDTLFAIMPGLDLTQTHIGTAFGENLKIIGAQVPTAAIGVIHHTPKSEAATGIGSRSIDALFDATLFVEETVDGGRIKMVKGNTVSEWLPDLAWNGELLKVEDDGVEISTYRPQQVARGARRWAPRSDQQKIISALDDLLVGADQKLPREQRVTKGDLRAAVSEEISRTKFYRILNTQLLGREILDRGKFVWTLAALADPTPAELAANATAIFE